MKTTTVPVLSAAPGGYTTSHVFDGEDDVLLTPKEAATFLRVSQSYLDKLRVYGGGPKFLRFGRKILYRGSELSLWVEQRCFSSTSEYAASPDHPIENHASLRGSGEHR
jgi:hypothetical protein